MNTNKLMKSLLWGVSALAGFVVAEMIYQTGSSTLNRRELIGDCEVIDETNEIIDEDIPF